MRTQPGLKRTWLVVVMAAVIALAFPAVAAPAPSAQPSEDVIVVLRDSPREPGAVAAEHRRAYGLRERFVYRNALAGYAASVPSERVAALARDPAVAYLSPDRPVTAAAQSLPTSVNRIDGELSSTASGNGAGAVNVDVAVLDTGVDLDHPDLSVAGGTDCSGDGRGYDDFDGHGSHVAGSVGMRDNTLGHVGIAPGARIWSARVLKDRFTGSIATVICGIDWVTATRTDAVTTNDIEVANMSLGTPGADDGACGGVNADALHAAICRSTAAGVLYVVAAHNQAQDLRTMVPAAYDEVLTATAMADYDGRPGGRGLFAPSGCSKSEPDDRYASFSNYATLAADQAHTVAAPGRCVLSTMHNGGYGYMWGTSMAAPHIAGTAALCIVAGRCTGTSAAMIQTLVQGARQYTNSKSSYGYTGDPRRPVSGRYFGYLIRAAGY